MLLRKYALVWLLMMGMAGTLYSTGLVDEMTMVLIGFVSVTLVFIGMVAVLPWWTHHHAPES